MASTHSNRPHHKNNKCTRHIPYGKRNKAISGSSMLRRPTHTYGKRSSRSTKGRSTYLAPTQTEDSSPGSSQDGEQVREASIVHQAPTTCVRQALPAISTNAGPLKKRSMLPTASTSRMPEVIIYSPKRARVHTEAQSKSIDLSVSPFNFPSLPSKSPSNSPSTYQPLRDYKGKGRMQEIPVEARQSSSDSTSTESDCITVTSKALYRTRPRTGQSSNDELPNSAVLSTPRRSTKRYLSSSPETASDAMVERTAPHKVNSPSPRCRTESLPGQSTVHNSSTRHSMKKPCLKSENSMDSLFDELLGNPNACDKVSTYLSKTQDCESLFTHMASRPAPNESPRSSLTRSPSLSASPLRLRRNRSSIMDNGGGANSLADRNFHSDSTSTLVKVHSAFLAIESVLNPAETNLEDTQANKHSIVPSRPSPSAMNLSQIPRATLSRSNSATSLSASVHTTSSIIRSPSDTRLTASAMEDKGATGLRSSPASDSGDNPDEADAVMHSVSQLRAAGDSRRFGDEMHYLLEGVEDGQPLGLHRASSMDILTKLEDEDFVRKLKLYDFTTQLYTIFRRLQAGHSDVILDITLLLFLYAICTDRHTTETLIHTPRIESPSLLKVICGMLSRDWIHEQLVDASRSGTKPVKSSLAALNNFALRLFSNRDGRLGNASSTGREILLRTLLAISKTLSSSFREFTSATLVQFILRSVQHETQVLKTHSSDSPDASQIKLSLQLFDRMTANFVSSIARGDTSLPLVPEEEIVNLAASLDKVLSVGASHFVRLESIPADEVTETVAISLKILVSLVDTSKTWSETLGTVDSQFMASLLRCIQVAWNSELHGNDGTASVGTGVDVSATDILLLSMGLLQTMLESSPKARSVYQKLYIGNNCQTGCAIHCTCTQKVSATTQLCRMYISRDLKADQDEAQIFAGYASLIIIYGSLGNSRSQKALVQILQDNEDSLDMLKKAVEELLRLHSNADRIGLDASQTSSSDLRSLLSEIEHAGYCMIGMQDRKS